jgi:hypothetical protein
MHLNYFTILHVFVFEDGRCSLFERSSGFVQRLFENSTATLEKESKMWKGYK